jgi:hypothetical protein
MKWFRQENQPATTLVMLVSLYLVSLAVKVLLFLSF